MLFAGRLGLALIRPDVFLLVRLLRPGFDSLLVVDVSDRVFLQDINPVPQCWQHLVPKRDCLYHNMFPPSRQATIFHHDLAMRRTAPGKAYSGLAIGASPSEIHFNICNGTIWKSPLGFHGLVALLIPPIWHQSRDSFEALLRLRAQHLSQAKNHVCTKVHKRPTGKIVYEAYIIIRKGSIPQDH